MYRRSAGHIGDNVAPTKQHLHAFNTSNPINSEGRPCTRSSGSTGLWFRDPGNCRIPGVLLSHDRRHGHWASSASPDLLDMARQLSASRWQILQKILSSRRFTVHTLWSESGHNTAVIGAVIGEFVGSNSGLQFQLLTATARFDGTKAFAAIVILSVMSLVLYGAVGVLGRILVPWHGKA